MKKREIYKRIIKIAVISLFIFLVTSFAYLWIDSERDYLKFRAEGLSLSEAAPSGVKYIRKYLSKSWDAPDSLKKLFARESKGDRLFIREEFKYKESITISFVGDIMWIRNGWSSFLDDSVRRYLSKSDMVFGNLETPIDTLAHVPSLLPDYANYNSNPELLRSFRRDDGVNIFTALSFANNHTLDKGVKGLDMTLQFLEKEGILATGASRATNIGQRDYLLIEKMGVRIGFYAATWGLNNLDFLNSGEVIINRIYGIAPLQKDIIDLSSKFAIIEKMRDDSVDIKIMFLHWGYEYELYPDIEIVRIGRELAKAGADLIVGSHSHVVQPYEICLGNGYNSVSDSLKAYYYNFNDPTGVPRKSLILYSLGNFTTAMYTPLCRLGLIQNVTLFRNSSTGVWDWDLGESAFVYNNSTGFAGSKRKLLFYKDYIENLTAKSPGRAAKIDAEVRSVLQQYE
jgi:poly-gamma-glutamate capsule biosynthesis protein CapA/YwtB (metallophosphatase superfamily)